MNNGNKRNNSRRRRGPRGPAKDQGNRNAATPAPAAVAPPVPQKANPLSRTSSTTRSQMTQARFADLPTSQQSKRAMAEVLRYEFMTKVQETTIPVSLTGCDVLAKAKTGTGKTLAFLIPACEALLRLPQGARGGGISGLIISPTRELATQIAAEGKQLISFMPIRMQVVFGGTNIRTDLRLFNNSCPDLLVATPGRLNDHLENHGLQSKMQSLRVMVFDEADQLLEMGFRPAITAMLKMLPPKNTRQTLLFSATMPSDVMGIARFALRDSFEHIDCVGEEQSTHQHVQQECLVHPLSAQIQELAVILREAIERDSSDFKIIVFFTTARLTQFFAEPV